MTLKIRMDGKIVIYAPHHTSKGDIDMFFKEKSSWISKKLIERDRQIDSTEQVKRFVSGERFLYLGEDYPLKFHDTNGGNTPLKLLYGTFLLDKDRVDGAKELFIKWYRKRAAEEVGERVDYYSKRLRLFPLNIKITSARSRYGSCSPDNRLSFSWRIVMAPYPIIDYVVIHELAHIREKNHSRKFWSNVEKIIPDYKKRRLWLRKNGHLLMV